MTDVIQKQFEQFHLDNPNVYRGLVKRARALVDSGVQQFGIALIYEAMRYEGLVTHGSTYKLPNNFRSRYARLIQQKHPKLGSHIRTKSLRS